MSEKQTKSNYKLAEIIKEVSTKRNIILEDFPKNHFDYSIFKIENMIGIYKDNVHSKIIGKKGKLSLFYIAKIKSGNHLFSDINEGLILKDGKREILLYSQENKRGFIDIQNNEVDNKNSDLEILLRSNFSYNTLDRSCEFYLDNEFHVEKIKELIDGFFGRIKVFR